MSQFSKLVMTEKGQALMAKMIAGTGDIEFTKVCTSSAEYQEDQLVTLTELSDIRQTSLVSGVTRTNDVTIKIEAAYSNADLTIGYYMRTIGLHAVDPDEGEILYAVTIETSGNCYMPPYNGVTVTAAYIQLYTTVGNSENVSLEVDPGAYATIGQIRELDKKKVDVFDGDISNTKISSFTTSTADYPVPAAGDTTKAAFGKMEKFLKDIKEWMVEKVVTSDTFQAQLSKYLVNNGLATEAGKTALDGAYGKTLADQITKLNSDLGAKFTPDKNYITTAVQRISDVIGDGSSEKSLFSDVLFMVRDKKIRSGCFGFNNMNYFDLPDNVSRWGYVEFFQHADNFITVKLYPESTLPEIFIRRFILGEDNWAENWFKAELVEVSKKSLENPS